MYKAFDRVNYDNLNVGHDTANGTTAPRPLFNPGPLVDISCWQINCNYNLIQDALQVIPTHLVPLLMKVAIEKCQPLAVAALVSHWPLPTLCFREILGSAYMRKSKGELFLGDMGLDVILFQGVTSRKPTCMLTTLDLRGFKLHQGYVKLVSRVWPLLSLSKEQLDTQKLIDHVITHTEAVFGYPMQRGTVLPEVVANLVDKEVINSPQFSITVPKGTTLDVLIDNIQFYNGSRVVMEYMIVNSLRGITPLRVIPSTVSVDCDPRQTDDTSLPLAVLVNQDPQTLEGISIRQLGDGVFNRVCKTIKKFTKIRALDISDCGLYLQHGRTRNRTATRLNIMETLHHFGALIRLDLSQNYLVGCLKEILASLPRPLEYLNLNSCDLNQDDIASLTRSHHASNLRELNISKIIQTSLYIFSGIEASFLVSSLTTFTELRVLNMSHNFIRSTNLINTLCTSLCKGSRKLKIFDFQGNAISNDNQLDMSFLLSQIPAMKWLRFTYYCTLSEELSADLIDRNISSLQRRIDDRLRYVGRADMKVDVSRLMYTLYLDHNMDI